MKKIFSIFLCLIMILSIGSISNAQSTDKIDEKDYEKIKNEIEKDKTTIDDELDKFLKSCDKNFSYEEAHEIKENMIIAKACVKFGLKDANEVSNNQEASEYCLKELIRIEGGNPNKINEDVEKQIDESFSKEEAEKMKAKFKETNKSENKKSTIDKKSSKDSTDLLDKKISNAAIAWFYEKGYNLAANLLARSIYVENTNDFILNENLKKPLYNTLAYNSLKIKSAYPKGSSKECGFINSSSKEELDSALGIYGFKASMEEDKINFSCEFDLAKNKTNNDVLNICKKLQAKKIINSYKISFSLKR